MRRNRLGGDDHFARILTENRVVQRAAPLGRTSVTNGHTEFNGNESLLVNGSQKVTGWLIVTGTLKLVGSLLLEGITTLTGSLIASGSALFTGAFTSRGTTRFEGDTTQVGPFHVVGATDLLGDVHVDAAGKIYIGTSMRFDPSIASGAIVFSNGAQLFTNANSAQLYMASTAVQVKAEQLDLISGSASLTVGSALGVRVPALATIAAAGHTPNIWCDPANGKLYRVI